MLLGLEAVYLGDVLPPEVARSLFGDGLITASLFAYLSVLVHGKLHSRETGRPPRQPRRLASWAARLLAAGAAYLGLFVAGGLLIFQPLAVWLEPLDGPAYIAAFQPEHPLLVLLFQFARGVLWALGRGNS